jgi:drug/metabolite transporter (DMT)-like permease
LVALASYGLSINIAAPLQQAYGALPVLWRVQMAALVMSLPLGGYALADSSFALVPLLAMVALGVGGTALAFVAMTTLIGRVGGSRASVTIYITPPVALFLGWLLRDDAVAPIAIAGSAIAILAAWVVSREKVAS